MLSLLICSHISSYLLWKMRAGAAADSPRRGGKGKWQVLAAASALCAKSQSFPPGTWLSLKQTRKELMSALIWTLMGSCSLWRFSQRAREGLLQLHSEAPLYESSWQRGHTRLRKIHCSAAHQLTSTGADRRIINEMCANIITCGHRETFGTVFHVQIKLHLNCRLQVSNALLGGGGERESLKTLHHIALKTAGTGREQSEDGGKNRQAWETRVFGLLCSFYCNRRIRCKCHSFEKSSKVQVLPPYISLTLVNVVAMAPGYLPNTLCTFAEIIRSISQWKGKTA